MIQVIDCKSIFEYQEKDIMEEMAGRKAVGLLQVPSAWRLPFFVIHQNVAENYIKATESERSRLVAVVSARIRECIRLWSLGEKERIIIRSSGKEEGMSERGKYDSEDCMVSAVEETIEKLFGLSISEGYGPIAYIVQPFADRIEYGHLSNERRVSKDARDWKYEFEGSNSEVYSLGIRPWRTALDTAFISEDNLICDQKKEIGAVLRRVAYRYTVKMKGKRVHQEFVWNGGRIFIVQNDVEQYPETEVNPEKLPKRNNMEKLEHLKVFREVDKSEESEFSKIENVKKYAEWGLPTAPFYMIRDREVIESLASGSVSEALKEDIVLLAAHSVVVRTDVSKYETADRQLLPRSNELRSFEAFMEWAQNGLPELLKYQDIILLVHVFIPAVSAVFAYASPDNRIVTIQSLWGLPEGLYYNTHDTTQVDTGTRYMDHVDEDKITDIKMRKAYKGFFYAPDESGTWKEMVPSPPYDWKMSITKKQARRIAWGSRLIAQKENKSLSIMWFAGVDENYYKTDCLPWYHEEVSERTFTHDVYQKKYYTQREALISSEEDLNNIGDIREVGAITIHPRDDSVLRNKKFLNEVGKFAKKNDIAIFLEGTVLAHPVYRLMSQGVKVVLANSEIVLFGWEQFNKLVRDKIPDKIQSNMEGVRCYVAKEGFLLRYLKEKLVEEAYEVLDAETTEDMVEELADVYEVTTGIRRLAEKETYFKINRTGKPMITEEADLLQKITLTNLMRKMEKADYAAEYFMGFCLERNHQELELELRFFEGEQEEILYDRKIEYLSAEELLYLAYQLLDTYEQDEICQICDRIEAQISCKAKQSGYALDRVEEIGDKKRERNGGFEKGYILKETSKNARYETEEQTDSWGIEHDTSYAEINELLFNPVTYVDYRKAAQGELLIRIRYPLCFENQSNRFSGKAVNKMFGIGSKLYVIAERICEKYVFSIFLERYQQLSLEFLSEER